MHRRLEKFDRRFSLNWAALRTDLLFSTEAALWTDAVVPGQPVPIGWRFFWLKPEGVTATHVTAEVYLVAGNVLLYRSPRTPLTAIGRRVDSGEQAAMIQPPTPGGAANALYALGVKPLRIDVLVEGTSIIFSEFADLEVLRDDLGQWGWGDVTSEPPATRVTVPVVFPFSPYYRVVINHRFTITGRMFNRSRGRVTTTGSVTLIENDEGSSTMRKLETSAFHVAPGGDQEIAFEPITKNWGWLIPGIWTRNYSEPLHKTFIYGVHVTIADPFGNAYPETRAPGDLRILVEVNDEKRGYLSGALSALAVGVIAAIFSFGAGLGAGQALAAGLGKKAQDPPDPDPRYRDPVDLGSNDIPPPPTKLPPKSPMRGLWRLLALGRRAMYLIDALGDIHNRILGAALAGDDRALRRQRDAYRAADRVLQETVAVLVDSTSAVASELSRTPELSADAVERTLRTWQREGLPAAACRQLVESGCTSENLAPLVQVINEPNVELVVRDPSRTVELLAWSIAWAAVQVHENVERVAGDGGKPTRDRPDKKAPPKKRRRPTSP